MKISLIKTNNHLKIMDKIENINMMIVNYLNLLKIQYHKLIHQLMTNLKAINLILTTSRIIDLLEQRNL